MAELSRSARKFQRYLEQQQLPLEVIELPASTRSAADAAAALDCDQAQIVKSMVFRAIGSDAPVVVLASGTNRVDESTIAEALGERIDKPDAKFVKQRTGFSIGGVAPIGHREPCVVFVDHDLLKHDILWAAAGTPHAVFRVDRPITDILGEHLMVSFG
ncbi:YbaK/EbsC family protein [Salinisphaera sp. LB1]|uniref:YbaK/EbsC family protein n=1 Tax=Salinisphaera sp. LB1 TaxID=2183911 RepID=UPI000D707D2B|nr:YbaK/EbsC family protein [Salinisphaera sp. LB1]